MSSQSQKNYIYGLDSLRGIAAISIVFLHFTTYLFPEIGKAILQYTPALKRTYLFVDMFFIISGFVLAHNYQQVFSQSIKFSQYLLFVLKRLIKIYPLHLVTLLILMLFFGISQPIPESAENSGVIINPATLLMNLTLTQSWGLADQGCLNCTSWNYPSWSISVEWLSYLFMPFVFWLAMRLKSVFVLLSFLLLFLVYYLIEVPHGHLDYSSWPGVLRCFTGVFIGVSLKNYGKRLTCVCFPILGLAVVSLLLHFSVWDTPIILGLAYMVVTVVNSDQEGWVVNPLLQYLGQRSYSIYMIHGVVHLLFGYWPQVVFEMKLFGSLDLAESLLGLVLTISFTLFLSEVGYRMIEIKLAKFLKTKITAFPIYS